MQPGPGAPRAEGGRGQQAGGRRSVAAADDDGAGGVVRHVVADAAQEGALELAQSPRAAHDHARALVVGRLDDGLARLALALADLARHLGTLKHGLH